MAGFVWAAHRDSATAAKLALLMHGTARAAVPEMPSEPMQVLLHAPQSRGCQRCVVHAAMLHVATTAANVVLAAAQKLGATNVPSSRRQEASRRRVPPPHAAEHAPQRLYT